MGTDQKVSGFLAALPPISHMALSAHASVARSVSRWPTTVMGTEPRLLGSTAQSIRVRNEPKWTCC